ncbi:Rpn family recombination-promoting nuclease/putative transposase [Candidatus Fukatsuia endosymbiont of Tuberolachnus salignus]
MSNVNVARDFLQFHLPPEIKEQCDFSTLKIEPGSFIEPNLRQHYSDIVYSLKTKEGKRCYIHCLIEHQSTPKKLMAFRLFRYSIPIMQQHLDQGHDELPVVIPILFYHGETSPYPYSMDWLDCFADRDLAQRVYSQPFPLVDVTTIPDEEILTHRSVALLELVQKHIYARDIIVISQSIAHLLNTGYTESELVKTLMYYIAQRGKTADTPQFFKTIVEHAPTYSEDIMTIAQDLRREGREEGMQQGMQQGRQETKLEIAKQLLKSGVDSALVKTSTGLSDRDIEDIEVLLH